MTAGVAAFAEDVRDRRYPAPEHGYSIDPDELERSAPSSRPRDGADREPAHEARTAPDASAGARIGRRRSIRPVVTIACPTRIAHLRARRPSRARMARLAHLFASRDRVFFELFAQLAANAVRAAELLVEMLEHYPDRREELSRDDPASRAGGRPDQLRHRSTSG